MSRKLITLDELRDYCIANSLYSFQSKNDNEALLISVPAKIKCFDTNDDQAVYLNIKACHTKENANHSYISEESMEEALPSFQLKPILASIVEKTDRDGNTTLDFNGHDMEIENDKMNPDEERINYIEQVVGVVSPDNIHMEADENSDKQYVYATGIVFKDYTYAADILEQRQDVDVSVEIAVTDFSYDTKLGVLMIDKFRFSGITLLGSEVKPGMVGSHATLQTYGEDEVVIQGYSAHNNLGLSSQLMDELAQAIRKFYLLMAQLPDTKEGETMTKFEELLAQYGITADDVDFEYENLSDEELEQAFADHFDSDDSASGESSEGDESGEGESASTAEPEEDPEEDPDGEDDSDDELTIEVEKRKENTEDGVQYAISVDFKGQNRAFDLSLNEKISALYELVNEVYLDDNTWYGVTVYDDYVIMMDYCNSNRYYKQSYAENDGVFTLIGDRIQVYVEYVTADEQASLDEMRQNYEGLVEFKANTEAAAIHAQREEIVNDPRYAVMAEDEKFQELIANMDNYSIEELSKEVKALHSDFINDHPESINFSSKKESPKTFKQVAYGMKFGQEKDEKKPYGNLFNK